LLSVFLFPFTLPNPLSLMTPSLQGWEMEKPYEADQIHAGGVVL
jgi:hypothetical protein